MIIAIIVTYRRKNGHTGEILDYRLNYSLDCVKSEWPVSVWL